MAFDRYFFVDYDGLNQPKLNGLAFYVAQQLENFFPAGRLHNDAIEISNALPFVINRLKPILNSVKMFDSQVFDCYNSLQYTVFLYLLANQIYVNESSQQLPARLFCLNKGLGSIDLFYSLELPEVFFIPHGVGTVLGNAKYGNRIVIFQNVTVGRLGDLKPVIGSDVIIYPGAIITGKSIIGNKCVISAGVVLHNVIVPDNSIVKNVNGLISIVDNKKNYIDMYFS